MTSHVKKKNLSSKKKAEVKQLDEEHTWTQNMGMTAFSLVSTHVLGILPSDEWSMLKKELNCKVLVGLKSDSFPRII